MRDDRSTITDRLANGAFVAIMGLARLLPYSRRIPAMGWVFSHMIAPIAGWRRRIRDNLALARPDLSPAEVEALVRIGMSTHDALGAASWRAREWLGADGLERARVTPDVPGGARTAQSHRAATAELGSAVQAQA